MFWGGVGRIESPSTFLRDYERMQKTMPVRLMGFGELALLLYCATDAQTLSCVSATSSCILNTFSCEQQGNINFQLGSRKYCACSTSDHFTKWEYRPEGSFLAIDHWQVIGIQGSHY